MNVYDSNIGTIHVTGLYAEVDNRWDKHFESEKELEAWLKENGARWIGAE